MDLSVLLGLELREKTPLFDITVGGSYTVSETFSHKGFEVGNFTSFSRVYISDGETKHEIGQKLIEYTAPWKDIEEARLGLVPASELELRRLQLSLCLEVSDRLAAKGIKTTVTGKSIDDIRCIVGEWSDLMESCYR